MRREAPSRGAAARLPGTTGPWGSAELWAEGFSESCTGSECRVPWDVKLIPRATEMGGTLDPTLSLYRKEHEIQRGEVTARVTWHPAAKADWIPRLPSPPPEIPLPSPSGHSPRSASGFSSVQGTQGAITPTPSRHSASLGFKITPEFSKGNIFWFWFCSSTHLKKSESPF